MNTKQHCYPDTAPRRRRRTHSGRRRRPENTGERDKGRKGPRQLGEDGPGLITNGGQLGAPWGSDADLQYWHVPEQRYVYRYWPWGPTPGTFRNTRYVHRGPATEEEGEDEAPVTTEVDDIMKWAKDKYDREQVEKARIMAMGSVCLTETLLQLMHKIEIPEWDEDQRRRMHRPAAAAGDPEEEEPTHCRVPAGRHRWGPEESATDHGEIRDAMDRWIDQFRSRYRREPTMTELENDEEMVGRHSVYIHARRGMNEEGRRNTAGWTRNRKKELAEEKARLHKLREATRRYAEGRERLEDRREADSNPSPATTEEDHQTQTYMAAAERGLEEQITRAEEGDRARGRAYRRAKQMRANRGRER